MAAQDLASLVAVDISESGPDLLNRQVDPSQRLDEASLTDLIPAVASVAAVGVDLGWCEDPDVVVVTQGMHRKATDTGEAPDAHHLVPGHANSIGPRATRESSPNLKFPLRAARHPPPSPLLPGGTHMVVLCGEPTGPNADRLERTRRFVARQRSGA